jgi:hypothetical protein
VVEAGPGSVSPVLPGAGARVSVAEGLYHAVDPGCVKPFSMQYDAYLDSIAERSTVRSPPLHDADAHDLRKDVAFDADAAAVAQ